MKRDIRASQRLVCFVTLASALGAAPALGQCPALLVWTHDRTIGLSFQTKLPKSFSITNAATGGVVYTYPPPMPTPVPGSNAIPPPLSTYATGAGGGCEAGVTSTGAPISCGVILEAYGTPPPPVGSAGTVTVKAPGKQPSAVPGLVQAPPDIYDVAIGPQQASLVNGTVYRINATCDGASWSTVDVLPPGRGKGPPTPSLVSANPVTISWMGLSARWVVDSFGILYASSPTGPWTGSASGLKTQSYTFPAGRLGGVCYVSVSAIDRNGVWGPPGMPLALTLPPATPPDLAAIPAFSAAGFGAVQLDWPPSMGATSYTIAGGSSAAGPFTDISRPSTNTQTINNLTMGATYYYVVRATGPTGTSSNSPVAAYVAKKYLPL